jgi:hypothetical protein
MKRNDSVIGERDFTDGVRRPVHQSDDGRQYVLDRGKLPVFGMWLSPLGGDEVPIPHANGHRRT